VGSPAKMVKHGRDGSTSRKAAYWSWPQPRGCRVLLVKYDGELIGVPRPLALIIRKKRPLALGRRRKLQAAWLSLQWLQYSTPTQFLLSGVYWI
jgi:hypothetical protein